MDTRCSGRQECFVAIPDGVMHQQQPCPSDMMAYLEASFVCIRGRVALYSAYILIRQFKVGARTLSVMRLHAAFGQ